MLGGVVVVPVQVVQQHFQFGSGLTAAGQLTDRDADAAPDLADLEQPELDGPVFLLGTCALVDTTWALVGEDPLSEVLGVLLPTRAA